MTFRDLELLVGCEKCGAASGTMCTTITGRRATLVHAVRATPIYDAWRKGFIEGQRDIILALDHGDERYIGARRDQIAADGDLA